MVQTDELKNNLAIVFLKTPAKKSAFVQVAKLMVSSCYVGLKVLVLQQQSPLHLWYTITVRRARQSRRTCGFCIFEVQSLHMGLLRVRALVMKC
jgi:hypothetical protein